MKPPYRTHKLMEGIMLILVLLLAGCVDINRPDWVHYAEISGQGWNPEDVLIYEPVPADSLVPASTLYDFKVIMRSATRSNISELPVAVTVEDAEGVVRADTIIIGGSNGPHLESRKAYGVRETTFMLMKATPLKEGLSITLSPLADASNSKGLLNIGIEMRKSK